MDKILCKDTEIGKIDQHNEIPKEYLEKSNDEVLITNCWWGNDNEGEKLDSRQRWSFGSDISIEAPESIQTRLCCSPVDEFDSTVSSENEDLIVNSTDERDDSYKSYIQLSPACSPTFKKVLCNGDNKKQSKSHDVDTADDELIDYSKRYTTDTSMLAPENKHAGPSQVQQRQRRNMAVNSVNRQVPEKRASNSRSKVDPFGDYAETDLDQPTNYSLRYAEEDSDDEEEENPEFYTNNEQEDTVKTYYTEGTPSNFSTATSMSDLLSLEEGEGGAYKRHLSREQKQEAIEKSEKAVKDSKNRIRRKCISEEAKIPVVEEVRELKDYERKLEKLLTPPQSPAEPFDKEKENKSAMVNAEENYAQETPLMFSRSSSLDSLSEFDQNSIQDDESSVISDFSHRTSGAVSPSDLPDSPTQTVPPSPNKLKQANFHSQQEQQLNLPNQQQQKQTFQNQLQHQNFPNEQQQKQIFYNQQQSNFPNHQQQKQIIHNQQRQQSNFHDQQLNSCSQQKQNFPKQQQHQQNILNQQQRQQNLHNQQSQQKFNNQQQRQQNFYNQQQQQNFHNQYQRQQLFHNQQRQQRSFDNQQQQKLPLSKGPLRKPTAIQHPNQQQVDNKINSVNSLHQTSREQIYPKIINQTPPEQISVFEDGLVSFGKEESSRSSSRVPSSAASCLSALSIDDEEEEIPDTREIINKIAAIRVRSSAAGMQQAPMQKRYHSETYEPDKANYRQIQQNKVLNRHCTGYKNNHYVSRPKEQVQYVHVEQENDNIVTYSNKEIINNRYRDTLKEHWYHEEHLKNDNRYQTTRSLSKSPVAQRKNERTVVQQKPSTVEEVVAIDTVRIYCTEDTPTYISPFGSQSNLSALSMLSFSDDDSFGGHQAQNSTDAGEQSSSAFYETNHSRVDPYDSDANSEFSEDEVKCYDDEEGSSSLSRRIDVSPFDSQMNLANFSLLCIEEENEDELEEEAKREVEETNDETDKSLDEDSYDANAYERLSYENSDCSDDDSKVLEEYIKAGVTKLTRRAGDRD